MKKTVFNYASWQFFMRISGIQLLFIIFLSGMAWSNPSEAQKVLEKKIVLRADNQDIKTVLSQLEKQADVKFVYSSSLIHSNRKISARFKGETLESALNQIFNPLELDYKVSGKQIIIRPSV